MNAPDVDLILDVDREYRDKADAGVLRRIAPRRLNPAGEAWLPLLQTRRDGWDFSALYSKRVVRGREPECARHYRATRAAPDNPLQLELEA